MPRQRIVREKKLPKHTEFTSFCVNYLLLGSGPALKCGFFIQ